MEQISYSVTLDPKKFNEDTIKRELIRKIVDKNYKDFGKDIVLTDKDKEEIKRGIIRNVTDILEQRLFTNDYSDY